MTSTYNNLKWSTYNQILLFYRVSLLDLNWSKLSVVQEADIDIDLTAVFSLKKSPTCSPDLSPIEHIKEYKKYYWSSKTFSIWWV